MATITKRVRTQKNGEQTVRWWVTYKYDAEA